MKKIWKALGIAALVTAVPICFKKDEDTGKKTYQSLLISLDVGPGENGKNTAIGINIGEGVLTNAIYRLVNSKKETIHFADDDPEAAVVTNVIDFTQAAADHAQAVNNDTQAADEAQTADNDAQAAADEAQDAADEAITDLEEADEEDFDPEL